MTGKILYSFLLTYAMTCCMLGINRSFDKKVAKTPVNAGVKKEPVQEIEIKTDTIYLTPDDYYRNHVLTHSAAGLYYPYKNSIVLRYYVPVGDTLNMKRFCNVNNTSLLLTRRHEMEHARKAVLLKNDFYRDDPMVRARMAAMNEIMAPGAEIIEAMDYHCRTGRAFETTRPGILTADSAIMKICNDNYMGGPINYEFRPVADVILQNAQRSFYTAVNKGFYKDVIKKAYFNNRSTGYKKNTESAKYNNLCAFFPKANIWDDIFTYQAADGKMYNIFGAASQSVRQDMINRVDSLIFDALGPAKMVLAHKYGILY